MSFLNVEYLQEDYLLIRVESESCGQISNNSKLKLENSQENGFIAIFLLATVAFTTGALFALYSTTTNDNDVNSPIYNSSISSNISNPNTYSSSTTPISSVKGASITKSSTIGFIHYAVKLTTASPTSLTSTTGLTPYHR